MQDASAARLALSVAAVQFLGLVPCRHLINRSNAWLVAAAAEHILQASAPASAAYADIDAAVAAAHAGGDDVLCTWRPRYCLDVFIYTSPVGAECFLGVVMHGRVPTVEFFRSSDVIAVAAATPGVVFGHLTCDAGAAGAAQLNIMVYDGLALTARDAPRAPVRERYAWVQSMAAELERVRIGHAALLVQWAGCPSSHALVRDMPLPHEKGGIALLHTAAPYALYAFAPEDSAAEAPALQDAPRADPALQDAPPRPRHAEHAQIVATFD